jgi:hypothetical protein
MLYGVLNHVCTLGKGWRLAEKAMLAPDNLKINFLLVVGKRFLKQAQV